MPAASPARTAHVALVGNPNTGKTTLFNALTGLRHRVANYPGTTVEWKSGSWRLPGGDVELVDLPGSYSLRARSGEEAVVKDTLLGRVPGRPRPDLVVVLLDAANLERNFYVLSQVCELGLPVVVALNMMDSAAQKGIQVDVDAMAAKLGLPVAAIQANKRLGIEALAAQVEAALQDSSSIKPPLPHAAPLEQGSSDDIKAHYAWIRGILKGVETRPAIPRETVSDRIDRVLTHRVFGTAIFFFVMGMIFQSVFSWSKPVMQGISGLVDLASRHVGMWMPDGMLKSLVVDGALAGVGSVIVFLPQIAVLFFFIGILEDCGYMARTAFLMDKLLAKAGLSGKSFIPMLSSFACAVPGIMAARTMDNWKDRVVTMVVSPLMSCSARLPVYIIFISAFIPDRVYFGFAHLQTMVLLGLYLLGIVVAVPVVWVLKRVWLKGETPAFIMELPDYQLPNWPTIVLRMWHQAREFLQRAGTLIFAVSILVWFLSYFPRPAQITPPARQAGLQAVETAGVGASQQGERLRGSYMGQLGRFVEPVFKPLGWDWRISMAAIASFPAREVIVATLSTIFNLDAKDGEESKYEGLGGVLKKATWPDGRPLFTLATAFSIMIFFALCMQCASTLSVLRQETGSWRWPAFTFAYMTALAYIFAALAYGVITKCMALFS